VTFSDCDRGTLTYRLDDGDQEGNFPLIRVIPGSGNVCKSVAESSTQGVSYNSGMDAAWFNSEYSGQGLFFDVHVGETGNEFIFVSWFTYGNDTASGQRWLTAEGRIEGSNAELVIYDTQGGSFNDPQPAESVQVGTLGIDFIDCNKALLSYSLDDEQLAGEMPITRLIPGAQDWCQELSTPD